jgi:hypothetical protein
MKGVNIKRTTVDLPKSLHREAMVEGAKNEIFSWRQIVIAAVELWLAVKRGDLHVYNEKAVAPETFEFGPEHFAAPEGQRDE